MGKLDAEWLGDSSPMGKLDAEYRNEQALGQGVWHGVGLCWNSTGNNVESLGEPKSSTRCSSEEAGHLLGRGLLQNFHSSLEEGRRPNSPGTSWRRGAAIVSRGLEKKMFFTNLTSLVEFSLDITWQGCHAGVRTLGKICGIFPKLSRFSCISCILCGCGHPFCQCRIGIAAVSNIRSSDRQVRMSKDKERQKNGPALVSLRLLPLRVFRVKKRGSRSSVEPSKQHWQVPTKALLGHQEEVSVYSDTSSVRTATTIREFFREDKWCRFWKRLLVDDASCWLMVKQE
eukprot:s219_g41.t8